MRLLPRGYFARTLLLVALLLLLSHGAAIVLLFVNVASPAAERSANALADHWYSLRAALQVLPPAQHARFIDELAARGVEILPTLGSTRTFEARTRFQAVFIAHLHQRLGADVQLRITEQTPPRLWIRLPAGQRDYWVGVAQRPLERPFPNNLLWQLLVIVVLAVLGAWLVARRITRPLARLSAAVAQVGRGETPPVLAQRGPEEVRVVYRALNRMAQDVMQATEDRNLLLAGISHDLRTPLARLRLALEMSVGRIDPSLHPGMIQDVEEMDLIIGQFLSYVREGVSEAFEYSDLNALIQQLAERYAQQGQALALTLGDVPMLMLKPVALRRAITNLIENALRHGGGRVQVRTSVEDDKTVIAILDRGPGMMPDALARSQRPFTPADGRGVHGFGLAIVHRIVHLHGGEVGLLPRVGGGLEARIVLPLSPPAVIATAQTQPHTACRHCPPATGPT